MMRRTLRYPIIIAALFILYRLYHWGDDSSATTARWGRDGQMPGGRRNPLGFNKPASQAAPKLKPNPLLSPAAMQAINAPPYKGQIPLEGRRKMIVMAKTKKEDTRWVTEDLKDWEHSIYSADDHSPGVIPLRQNKGHEANAYLTYLIDHYDDLADVIVFLHAHRDRKSGWHIDNDEGSNLVAVRNLQLETVLKRGYVNMRCMYDPGCPVMFDPQEPLAPGDEHRKFEEAFLTTWPALFPDVKMPEYVGVACCAQFAVSKEQVLARPKSDYQRFQRWLLATPLEDQISGTMLEYVWHIIFGREAMHCPDLWECYCAVYGLECYIIEEIDDLDPYKGD